MKCEDRLRYFLGCHYTRVFQTGSGKAECWYRQGSEGPKLPFRGNEFGGGRSRALRRGRVLDPFAPQGRPSSSQEAPRAPPARSKRRNLLNHTLTLAFTAYALVVLGYLRQGNSEAEAVLLSNLTFRYLEGTKSTGSRGLSRSEL